MVPYWISVCAWVLSTPVWAYDILISCIGYVHCLVLTNEPGVCLSLPLSTLNSRGKTPLCTWDTPTSCLELVELSCRNCGHCPLLGTSSCIIRLLRGGVPKGFVSAGRYVASGRHRITPQRYGTGMRTSFERDYLDSYSLQLETYYEDLSIWWIISTAWCLWSRDGRVRETSAPWCDSAGLFLRYCSSKKYGERRIQSGADAAPRIGVVRQL